MTRRRSNSRRSLIAEQLESRELLAANALGRQTSMPDRVQVNAMPVVQSVMQVQETNQNQDASQQRGSKVGGANFTSSNLSQQEIDELLFMREEEKLARDVYLALSESTNSPIFNNIAQSEQRHMDSVGNLIDKYELDDPIQDDTPGVFTNATLQRLYDDLVSDHAVDLNYLGQDLVIEGGSTSPLAALKVGAFIEELDILDLQNAVENTTKADIESVYESLLDGSRSHLTAFTGQIQAMGETYEPLLMTEDSDPVDEKVDGKKQKRQNTGRENQRARIGNASVRMSMNKSDTVADSFFTRLGQRGSRR